MKVYYGKTTLTYEDVAVKIELKNKEISDVINEANILTRLKGISQIPAHYSFQIQNNKNIIAESFFGPSLKRFYENDKNIIESILVSIISLQIINILRKIHQRGIIYNDLKPNNICWVKFENSQYIDIYKFFLIDFGYSRRIDEGSYTNNNNDNAYKHYKELYENRYADTADYMAITILEGYRPSRRSDIQELIYILLFLFKKSYNGAI